MFPHIVIIFSVPYFFVWISISLWYHFPSVWTVFFPITCMIGLVVINSFDFCLKKSLPSFWKNSFARYRIVGWQGFSFRSLKMLLHHFWLALVLTRNLVAILILLCVMHSCPNSVCFQNFSLLLILSHVITMWLGVLFFMFIVLRVCWASWIFVSIVFIKFGKVLSITFSDIFPLFPYQTPITYLLGYLS